MLWFESTTQMRELRYGFRSFEHPPSADTYILT